MVGLHRCFHIQGVTYNRPPKSGKPLVLGSQTSILGEKRAKGFIFQLVFTKYEPFWAPNTGNIPDRGVTFGSNITMIKRYRNTETREIDYNFTVT